MILQREAPVRHALVLSLVALTLVACSKEPHSSNFPLQQNVYDTNGGSLIDPFTGARLDIAQQALGSSQPMLLNAANPIAAPPGFVQVGTCIRSGPAAFGFPVLSRMQIPFDPARLPPGATVNQVCILYQDTFFDPPIPLSAQTPHAFYVAPIASTSTTVSVLSVQTGLYEAVIPPTPPPTITALNPSESSISGGITVTLTGVGFESNAKVTINGIPQDNVTVVSPTQITFTNTPGPAIAADVRVQNPDGGRGEKFAAFNYKAP